MTPFNLLSEPWLPAHFAGEPRPRDVSIRDALVSAADIRRIADESPLVTVAAHRLLLAILHCVFPMATNADWRDLWRRGSFDGEALGRYFDPVADGFELFDEDHPFYQNPSLPAGSATSIAKLGHAFASGNNPLLFDHSEDDSPIGFAPAAAARLLIAHQSFAVGGLITRLPGDPPSAEASHLLKAAVILATGSNLFETLVLNMVRVAGLEKAPFEFKPDEDRPAWEQEPPTASERPLLGYVDLLTWQPRRVRLIPPGDDGLVRKVVIMDGYRWPKSVRAALDETMVAYTERPKAAANQDAEPPVGFRPEKALWRDSLALLQSGDTRHPPATLRHLAALPDHYLDRSRVIGLAAFGLSSDRAKLFLWRHEEFALPLAYLGNRDLVAELERAIAAAEDVGRQLRLATWIMAQAALAPDGNADRNRVNALVDSIAPERGYWPLLDAHFRRFIVDLADQYDLPGRFGEAAIAAWRDHLRNSARAAFERAARALETSSRGFRAAAEGRLRFSGLLAKALAPITPEPQEATA